jgi:hypothetical protein
MPYDFDQNLKSEKRVSITLRNTTAGSILVFHDSEKAFPQLRQELPSLMEQWKSAGYQFKAIS